VLEETSRKLLFAYNAAYATPPICAFVSKNSEDKKGPFVGRCIAKRYSYQSSIHSLGSFILFPFWETVLPLMALSELCCARIVTLRQRHSHGKARIRANIFIQQFMTKNYTLVYTVANLVLHRLHKCVREYMASDYRWLTLHNYPKKPLGGARSACPIT
jgi:hypothetical protein